MSYTSVVRFERIGDRLMPVRIRKEWVQMSPTGTSQATRKFITTRITVLSWRAVDNREEAPEPWCSWTQDPTRKRLRATGAVKEAGHGEPCLTYAPPSPYEDFVDRVGKMVPDEVSLQKLAAALETPRVPTPALVALFVAVELAGGVVVS